MPWAIFSSRTEAIFASARWTRTAASRPWLGLAPLVFPATAARRPMRKYLLLFLVWRWIRAEIVSLLIRQICGFARWIPTVSSQPWQETVRLVFPGTEGRQLMQLSWVPHRWLLILLATFTLLIPATGVSAKSIPP